jgi:hypothetical protein
MALGINKCAITRCPYKSKLQPLAFTTYLKAQNINYKQHLPILSQNEPYTYLGIRLVPSLKWAIQKEITIAKMKHQNIALFLSPALLQNKIKILNTVIRPSIEYAFYATPFSTPKPMKLDKLLIKLTKSTC